MSNLYRQTLYRKTVEIISSLIGDAPAQEWIESLSRIANDESRPLADQKAANEVIGVLNGDGKSQFEDQLRADTGKEVSVAKSDSKAMAKPGSMADLEAYVRSVPELDKHEQLRQLITTANDVNNPEKARIDAADGCLQIVEQYRTTGAVGEVVLLAGESASPLNPSMLAAAAISESASGNTGSLQQLVSALDDLSLRVVQGDTTDILKNLACQTQVLNGNYNELTKLGIRMAGTKVGAEYIRLALKTQKQCIETVQVVDRLLNPPVRIGQQNIAQNQQINNHPAEKNRETNCGSGE